MTTTFLIGIGLNVTGSVLFNLACNLLKLASDNSPGTASEVVSVSTISSTCGTPFSSPTRQQPECKATVNDPPTTSARTSCGSSPLLTPFAWCLFVVASLINYASFAFASSSLLASLGGVQLLSNLFFSAMVLGETLKVVHLASTTLLIAGMVTSTTFANHSVLIYTLPEIEALYVHKGYLILLGCLVVATVAAQFLLLRPPRWLLCARSESTRALLYAFISAAVGTQSVLQSKCLAEILKHCIVERSASEMGHPTFVSILVVFVATLCVWMYRLKRALQLFDGLLIIPLVQVCWVLLATMQSAVFFQDFQRGAGLETEEGAGNLAAYLAGTVLTLSGVYLLAFSNEEATQQQEQEGKRKSVLVMELTDCLLFESGTDGGCESPCRSPLPLLSLRRTNPAYLRLRLLECVSPGKRSTSVKPNVGGTAETVLVAGESLPTAHSSTAVSTTDSGYTKSKVKGNKGKDRANDAGTVEAAAVDSFAIDPFAAAAALMIASEAAALGRERAVSRASLSSSDGSLSSDNRSVTASAATSARQLPFSPAGGGFGPVLSAGIGQVYSPVGVSPKYDCHMSPPFGRLQTPVQQQPPPVQAVSQYQYTSLAVCMRGSGSGGRSGSGSGSSGGGSQGSGGSSGTGSESGSESGKQHSSVDNAGGRELLEIDDGDGADGDDADGDCEWQAQGSPTEASLLTPSQRRRAAFS